MGDRGRIVRGVSTATDSKQAAKELYEALNVKETEAVFFYCSPNYDLEVLGKSLNHYFGDIELIGCTTAGEISSIGYSQDSISGFSLPKSDFKVSTIHFDQIQDFSVPNSRSSVKALIDQMAQQCEITAENSFGYLLVDGSSVKEESVISSIYSGLEGIGIFGASAGDGLNFGKTYIYYHGAFHENSAMLTIINTNRPFKLFKTQHFIPSEKKLVITEAIPERRIVTEINGEPAAQEYAEVLGLDVENLSPQIFASYPVMLKVGGSYFVRSIQQVNEDGSLTFYCAIDEGIVLTIAEGQDITENLVKTLDTIEAEIGHPDLIIGSDCILRRLELENRNLLEEVGKIMSDHNVTGFSTYGEQYDAMHINQTFTGVAIS